FEAAWKGRELDESQVRLLRERLLSPDTTLRQALLQVPEITRILPTLTEDSGVETLTAAQYATLNALVYLQYRGSSVDHVLVANGFADAGHGWATVSVKLPALFTEGFDALTDTAEGFKNPIHREFMAEFNARLGKNKDDAGYYLADNWVLL